MKLKKPKKPSVIELKFEIEKLKTQAQYLDEECNRVKGKLRKAKSLLQHYCTDLVKVLE
jgi:hypothetical protein